MREPNPEERVIDTTANPAAWKITLASGEKLARVTLYVSGQLLGSVDLALTVSEYEKLNDLGSAGNVYMSPNVYLD